jgi:hypothetical protein
MLDIFESSDEEIAEEKKSTHHFSKPITLSMNMMYYFHYI